MKARINLLFIWIIASTFMMGCGDTTLSSDDLVDATDLSSGIPDEIVAPAFSDDPGEGQSKFPTTPEGTEEGAEESTEEGAEESTENGEEGGAAGGEGEGPECETSANCAQDNLPSCTHAACLNGTCQIVAVEDGGECDDDDVCTEGTTCQIAQGGCVGGTTITCDDGDACTLDSCDSDVGCVFSVGDGSCDDGNICTVGDVCEEEGCLSGELTTCEDNNPCTEDSCDPESGCVFASLEGQTCEDGEACTSNDLCTDGICVPGESVCPLCTETSNCPAQDDLCAGTYACSMTGYCVVVAGTPVVCDDGKPCTGDACLPDTGECQYDVLADGEVCDDGNACTLNDTCSGGSCEPGSNAAGGSLCEDGNPCTELDTCLTGVCNPGETTAGCVPGCVGAPLMTGCAGCSCESCVCAIDAFCCESQWDESCAALCDTDCNGCDGNTGGGEEGGETPLPSGLCAGNCGGQSDDACYCDDNCFGFGDCCEDICNDCQDLASCGGGGTTGGGGACGAGEIEDCDGLCAPSSYLGDGFCDEGLFSSNLNCAALNFDEGDCGSGGCSSFEVSNCNGGCTTATWLGDGFCDFSLDCAETNFDNGDCSETTTGGEEGGGGEGDGCVVTTLEAGCNGCACETCVCNQDLWCCSTGWDSICVGLCEGCGTDCADTPVSCGFGQIEDCFGGCVFDSWLGDGLCDDVLNCAEKNFDDGDCDSCTPDCAGKTCGDDGCGSTCGAGCGFSEICVDGICEAEVVGPVCGNGIIEEGEACDGDCPLGCEDEDENPCTLETLEGYSFDCTATCVVAEVTTCGDLDGCCLPECSYPDDFDCDAPYCGDDICGVDENCPTDCCGNGILDSGEECDGDCPTEEVCEAMTTDTCTPFILQGTDFKCDAKCVEDIIPFCADDDGCCNSFCNSTLDNDCVEE